ncbi:streptophobe family protein [Streptomyces sp. NPDC052016]|uniref:streptophobe family protein n=1 Tax=Streptomyces sp. NPDC052016 TaxID=3365680 RepID=UPI0037D0D866
MGAGTDVEAVGSAEYGKGVPWADVVLSAIAAVSWALIGMAGTAALGLHLLGADAAGSLGPMTAAVVALAAGGSVTPSGDVSAFGLTGAQADTAIEITPLGVGLVGALLLSWFFLRSLRAAGVVVAPAELLARAGAVAALFVAMLGGLAWAGHDVITIDGGALGLDGLPGGDGGGGGGGAGIPGLGELGDIGGLLPDRIGDLVDAQAAVGFTVDTVPTLLGGLGWSVAVLTIALLASRRTPLPRGWQAVHRVVRPAVSAVVTVLLVAVAAGFAAAAYAAIGDDRPKRIAGAALLGAPNGVWLGVDIGLWVPWDGRASGALTGVLPDPLDELLGVGTEQSVTLGRLAELDARVWLLGAATTVMMLSAGVLMGARTPFGGTRGAGVRGFVGRCALRLGLVTAVTLPLLARLTDVSVGASLSVLGFDAFDAGLELRGHLGLALLLGAVWGAGAGAAGAALACATGAAGRRAAPLALGDSGAGAGARGGGARDGGARGGGVSHGGADSRSYGDDRPGGAGTAAGAGRASYGDDRRTVAGGSAAGAGPASYGDDWRTVAGGAGAASGQSPHADDWSTVAGDAGAGTGQPPHGDDWRMVGGTATGGPGDARRRGERSGPYAPGTPYRPPNPATNPYLRVPEDLGDPEDARPEGQGRRPSPRPPGGGRGEAATGGEEAGWADGPGEGSRSGASPPVPPPPGSRSVSGEGGVRPDSSRTDSSRTDDSRTDDSRTDEASGPGAEQASGGPPSLGDLYDAPTMVRPVGPPPRAPRRPSEAPGSGERPSRPSDEGPPPPPPPPPAAPPPDRPKRTR